MAGRKGRLAVFSGPMLVPPRTRICCPMPYRRDPLPVPCRSGARRDLPVAALLDQLHSPLLGRPVTVAERAADARHPIPDARAAEAEAAGRAVRALARRPDRLQIGGGV